MPTEPILSQSPAPWKVVEVARYDIDRDRSVPMFRIVDADGEDVGLADNSDRQLLSFVVGCVNVTSAITSAGRYDSQIVVSEASR